jgi:hypothetical protein
MRQFSSASVAKYDCLVVENWSRTSGENHFR